MDKPEECSEGLQELVRRIESSSRPARERGLAEKYSNEGKITTLMLRNIPSKYTQDMLIEELVDCMGSSDCFDFFYLPWDQQNDCNLSYAFVNLRSVQAAERCTRIFTNFSFRRFDSPKICKVYPAHIQGLENNVLHLMDRAVSDARSHYPVIMWKGEKLKLGKVIAALDGSRSRNGAGVPRVVVPASSPGNFFGNREPPLGPSTHIAGGGMNMEGLDQPWMDAKDSADWPFGSPQAQGIPAPASVGLPSSRPAAPWPPGPSGGLDMDWPFCSLQAQGIRAPASVGAPSSLPAALRAPGPPGLGDGGAPAGPGGGLVPPLSGPWPRGPVTAGDSGVPSSPGPGAAGQPLPGPWPPGPAPPAEGAPPHLSAAGAAAGMRQCPEGPPPMLGGPPVQSAAGLLQRPSEGSAAAAASVMHAGPGMAQYPMEGPPVSAAPTMQSGQGLVQRLTEAGSNGGFQMGTAQYPMEGGGNGGFQMGGTAQYPTEGPPVSAAPTMQSGQGLVQRLHEAGSNGGFQMGGTAQYPTEGPPVSAAPTVQSGQGLVRRLSEEGSNGFQMGAEPAGVRTVGLRNPNDDVLAKFLDSLGT